MSDQTYRIGHTTKPDRQPLQTLQTLQILEKMIEGDQIIISNRHETP